MYHVFTTRTMYHVLRVRNKTRTMVYHSYHVRTYLSRDVTHIRLGAFVNIRVFHNTLQFLHNSSHGANTYLHQDLLWEAHDDPAMQAFANPRHPFTHFLTLALGRFRQRSVVYCNVRYEAGAVFGPKRTHVLSNTWAAQAPRKHKKQHNGQRPAHHNGQRPAHHRRALVCACCEARLDVKNYHENMEYLKKK